MRLLLAETFEGSTDAGKSVHEVHFKRPVRLAAFRVVAQGDVPHPELNFQGKTLAAPFLLELFGAQVGKGPLCSALWQGEAPTSSALELLSSEGLCDYMVVRCASPQCRLRRARLRLMWTHAWSAARYAESIRFRSRSACTALRATRPHRLPLLGSRSQASGARHVHTRGPCAPASHRPGVERTGPDRQ